MIVPRDHSGPFGALASRDETLCKEKMELAEDVVVHVMHFAETATLCQMRGVCKWWRAVSNNIWLWRERYAEAFPFSKSLHCDGEERQKQQQQQQEEVTRTVNDYMIAVVDAARLQRALKEPNEHIKATELFTAFKVGDIMAANPDLSLVVVVANRSIMSAMLKVSKFRSFSFSEDASGTCVSSDDDVYIRVALRSSNGSYQTQQGFVCISDDGRWVVCGVGSFSFYYMPMLPISDQPGTNESHDLHPIFTLRNPLHKMPRSRTLYCVCALSNSQAYHNTDDENADDSNENREEKSLKTTVGCDMLLRGDSGDISKIRCTFETEDNLKRSGAAVIGSLTSTVIFKKDRPVELCKKLEREALVVATAVNGYDVFVVANRMHLLIHDMATGTLLYHGWIVDPALSANPNNFVIIAQYHDPLHNHQGSSSVIALAIIQEASVDVRLYDLAALIPPKEHAHLTDNKQLKETADDEIRRNNKAVNDNNDETDYVPTINGVPFETLQEAKMHGAATHMQLRFSGRHGQEKNLELCFSGRRVVLFNARTMRLFIWDTATGLVSKSLIIVKIPRTPTIIMFVKCIVTPDANSICGCDDDKPLLLTFVQPTAQHADDVDAAHDDDDDDNAVHSQ